MIQDQQTADLTKMQDNVKTLLGDQYAPAMAQITNVINSIIGVDQLGTVETYALVCKVLQTDAVTSSMVMAAAAEQVLA